jgi:hypothetical protein
MRALGADGAQIAARRGLLHGYCRSNLRWFWGHAPAPVLRTGWHIQGLDSRSRRPTGARGRPAALFLPTALRGGQQIVCDKGYAGREFAAEVEASFAAEILRPNRKDEPEGAVCLSVIRQRIESVFWTLKDLLGLERHRARTLIARIASKLLALAAGVWVKSWLGLPSRSFAQFAA